MKPRRQVSFDATGGSARMDTAMVRAQRRPSVMQVRNFEKARQRGDENFEIFVKSQRTSPGCLDQGGRGRGQAASGLGCPWLADMIWLPGRVPARWRGAAEVRRTAWGRRGSQELGGAGGLGR